MDIKTVLTSAAVSATVALAVPAMVNYATLQSATPGTPDTGNTNISGTAIAGKVRVGTTLAGGALVRVEDPTGSGGLYSRSGGTGVYSESTGLAGPLIGGQFTARSTTGRGVIGSATAPTGATRGGIFDSKSSSGVGVYGVSSALSGTGVGVFGSATAASGTAMVAVNPNAKERVELSGPNGAVFASADDQSGVGALVSTSYPNGKALVAVNYSSSLVELAGPKGGVYVENGTYTKSYGGGPKGAVPIAYGIVNGDGTIASAGSGNWASVRMSEGVFTVSVTNENFVYIAYPTIVILGYPGFMHTQSFGNDLYVETYKPDGFTLDDHYFTFFIYKSIPGALYPRAPKHGFKNDGVWAEKRPAEYAKFRAACQEAERTALRGTAPSSSGRP